MSYVRASILGTTLGGEKWSVNPTFDPNGEFPGGVDQAALDSAALAIANLSPASSLQNAMSVAMSIVGCRLEVRSDTDDNLIGISEQTRPTPFVGFTAARMPAQAASVFSLRTNTPGARGRGRLYWPALGISIGTDLRISAAVAGAMLPDMKTYLTAMRSALATAFPLIGFDLAVRSRTAHSTPHVVRIQLGNVPDTQRRRRDTLAESYLSTTFP